jgi:hypothetical protein
MTNYEKLEKAKQLLLELSRDWDEEQIENYESQHSFDELVDEICSIHLRR